jgi:hypothetical protein
MNYIYVLLPNGNLLVPDLAPYPGTMISGPGFREVGPSDPNYKQDLVKAVPITEMSSEQLRRHGLEARLKELLHEPNT